jgi:hypothetical protein
LRSVAPTQGEVLTLRRAIVFAVILYGVAPVVMNSSSLRVRA